MILHVLVNDKEIIACSPSSMREGTNKSVEVEVTDETLELLREYPEYFQFIEGELQQKTTEEIEAEQQKQLEEQQKAEMIPTPEERIEMLEQAIMFLAME